MMHDNNAKMKKVIFHFSRIHDQKRNLRISQRNYLYQKKCTKLIINLIYSFEGHLH